MWLLEGVLSAEAIAGGPNVEHALYVSGADYWVVFEGLSFVIGTFPHPERCRTPFLFAGFAVVLLASQVVLPRLITNTMPAELRQALPSQHSPGAVRGAAPRTY